MAIAEPEMIFTAASISFALRSAILMVATSSSCLRVILPADSLPGSFEPDFKPKTFLIRKVAGGAFMVKVKLLSAKTVIFVGIGVPFSMSAVAALNCLQNSMMFTPR